MPKGKTRPDNDIDILKVKYAIFTLIQFFYILFVSLTSSIFALTIAYLKGLSAGTPILFR